jgi:hypothetical protein
MMKYKESDYLVHDNWVGIGQRFWFMVRKKRRNRFVVEPITRRGLDDFKTEAEAIEYAKHMLWCYAEMIENPNQSLNSGAKSCAD